MPTDQEIADAGQKVFEMFGACGEAPDDTKVGKEADKVAGTPGETAQRTRHQVSKRRNSTCRPVPRCPDGAAKRF